MPKKKVIKIEAGEEPVLDQLDADQEAEDERSKKISIKNNIKKVNMFSEKNELLQANEIFGNSDAVEGKCMLTFPINMNSMRSIMFASQLNQFKNQINADFPQYFTAAENFVGAHSSGYKRVDESTVYKKIIKYEDIIDNPTEYMMFTYNKKKKRYEVYQRKEVENLLESFSYKWNNEKMDSLKEGDHINQDEVIKKSLSYDEYMNYSYGKDLLTLFNTDPYNSEDAVLISQEVVDKGYLTSVDSDEVSILINDNDYPINLYGDDDEYKVFPDIGEDTNGILMALRRKFNNQVLVDFKKENLQTVMSSDMKFYVKGKVTDIQIFCNNEQLEDNSFYHQIYKYYKSQCKYYKEIKKACESIFNSGSDYSGDVDYIYKRSCEQLDTIKKWVGKDKAPSNMEIKITVSRVVKPSLGQKMAGRFGNKSVISKIVPTEEMPYIKVNVNGKEEIRRVQVIESILADINRTIGAILFEQASNFISDKVSLYMKNNLKTKKEKEEFLFGYIKDFNEAYFNKIYNDYINDTPESQDEFLKYCEDVKIHLHQPSIKEPSPIFYRLKDIYAKYNDIVDLSPYTIYVNKFGREIECVGKAYVSNMYCILLKQTAIRGFSVRGMGAINSKGVPDRSYKSKAYKDLYSSTAVRFGETENMNFNIGMNSDEVALVNALYRTSIKARKDLGNAILKNKSVIETKATYDSRVAIFFEVILRSLGYRLRFLDSDDDFKSLDDSEINYYTFDNGISALCTEFQKTLIERRIEIGTEMLNEYGMINQDELEEMIDEEIEERKYFVGEYRENKDFFKDCVEVEKVRVKRVSTEEIMNDMNLINKEVD